MTENQNKKFKVGVVLPGGGAKGARQAGALKAIEDDGRFEIVAISGCSVGALNGAFYTEYCSADKLISIWKNELKGNSSVYKHWFPLSVLQGFLFNRGLFNTKPLKKLIKKHISENGLLNSEITLIVNAVNLNKGMNVSFYNNRENFGKLLDLVYASAAFPIGFPTITIDNQEYTDGGVMEQAPIFELLEAEKDGTINALDYVFVIPTGNFYADEKKDIGKTLLGRILRVIELMDSEILMNDFLVSHHDQRVNLIFPEKIHVESSLSFEPKSIEKAIQEGYSTTKKMLLNINSQ
jgi:NTE family protein